MKKLLWISRHEPNKIQIEQITERIGEVEIIKCNLSIKEYIKDQINTIKPDCIVVIIPFPWLSFLLKGVPKSTIWLKPKCKFIHSSELNSEPCEDFDVNSDIIIDPSEKRYEEYEPRGSMILHMRHVGYERIISSREQLLFIRWKNRNIYIL